MVYLSRFVSQSVACWLEASVHQLDTHAYVSADVCWRTETERYSHREAFFRNWVCDKAVFLDWIKRGVIARAELVPLDRPKERYADAMEEVQETLDASRPIVSIPLNEEAEVHDQRYRDPDPGFWYEAVISRLTDARAEFDISLWGHKYELEGLLAPRDVFFILTDRLNARVRFRGTWDLFAEAERRLRLMLAANSRALGRIRQELQDELTADGRVTDKSVDRRLRSLFPLLERMLREDAAARRWRTEGLRLDALIRQLGTRRVISDDSRQYASLVAKPYRDVVLHGRRLAPSVARAVLEALFDTFTRLARDLDAWQE